MDQETAVIKKPPGEIVGDSHSKVRLYEVIVKFHKDGREMIETFLLANMMSVTISAAGNDEVLLAYCHFQGDIKTLDSKLAALRQSAMVVLGDKEEKFLDFFVALRQVAHPLPHLLFSSEDRSLNFTKTRSGFLLGRLISSPAKWWVGLGFLVAIGLMTAVVMRYPFYSISPPPITPPVQLSSTVIPQWRLYVLPEYHSAWLAVKKKNSLSDETMITLFRKIKSIDQFGLGHPFRDLTIHPEAIDRALGLIILMNVGDADELRALYKTLRDDYILMKPLPDSASSREVSSLNPKAFDFTIAMILYEQLLKESRGEFIDQLIRELRKSHLSG